MLLVARKSNLRLLLEHFKNLAVGDITLLKVLFNRKALFVADSVLSVGHERVTRIVGLTNCAKVNLLSKTLG
jgi:hypothetical protein